MTALLVVDTLVVCLLTMLVAGLLRAHAVTTAALDDLNRAARGGDETRLAAGVPRPPNREGTPAAADVAGPLVGGGYAEVAFASGGANTVLGFLSSGCLTCRAFWAQFQPDVREPLPGGARLVLVTQDSSRESPSKLAKLAPPDVPVIMSSDAWEAYEVPAAPYFVYIDGVTGQVHGEGSALEWPQVVSLLTDALFDAAAAKGDDVVEGVPGHDGPVPRGDSNLERNLRADAALRAAGVEPDDPSFWPPGATRA